MTYLRRSSRLSAGLLAAAAGFLATRAVLESRRARRAAREFPPRGRYIRVNGEKLHVTEQGAGDSPLVFLHGNGATSEDFRISGLVNELAPAHRVLVFDRPGFGFSERSRFRPWHAARQGRAIQTALDQMEIERPILVGHSWGTLVALAMALDAPERIGGLVLISGFYFPEARADVAALLPAAVPLFGDVLRYTLSPPLVRAMKKPAYRKLFRPAKVSPRFAAEFPVALASRPSQLRAVAGDTAWLNPSAWSLQHRYGELRMPVAIVTGDGDRMVDPAKHAERLHACIQGSSLTSVKGAGHMVHHSASAEVLQAIRDLVVEVERRAPGRRAELAQAASA